jgi:pentatricopeptide repeat protein
VRYTSNASGHDTTTSTIQNPVEACSSKTQRSYNSPIEGHKTSLDIGVFRKIVCHQKLPETYTQDAPSATSEKPASENFHDSYSGEDEFRKVHGKIWGSLGETEQFAFEQKLDPHSKPCGETEGVAASKVACLERKVINNPGDGEHRKPYDIWDVEEETEKLPKIMQEMTFHGRRRSTFRVAASESPFQQNRHSDCPERTVSLRHYPTRVDLISRHSRFHFLTLRDVRSRSSRELPGPVELNDMGMNVEKDLELINSYYLWRVEFADLYVTLGVRDFRPPPLRNVEDIKIFQTLKYHLSKASPQPFLGAWESFDAAKRVKMWQRMMLAFLYRDPTSALKFLVLTCGGHLPPGYAITDSLEYLFQHFLRDINVGTVFCRPLLAAAVRLFECTGHGHFILNANTIRLLLPYLEPWEIEQFYATLIRYRNPLRHDILKFIVLILARRGRTNLAVEALQRLYDGGADFNGGPIRYSCVVLLREKYRDNSSSAISDSDLFAFLLDRGLRPNITFYNILLHNSLKAGDHETAWQIHDMMLDNGIKPNARTYSHLLNDAKLRMDHSMMENILSIVEPKGIMNPHIITDILHAMFLFSEREREEIPVHVRRNYTFERMLEFYSKFFELGPLALLIPGSNRALSGLGENHGKKISPPSPTLCLMITSYIKGLGSDYLIMEWYKYFRKLVVEDRADIKRIVTTSHIYDTVIMCLGRFPQTLSRCMEIIADMIASCEESVGESLFLERPTGTSMVSWSPQLPFLKFRDQKPHSVISRQYIEGKGLEPVEYSLKHCAPSVWTWSILLNACMRHGQLRAAERILTTMRSQGITPTKVTWNILATGYSRMQDIPKTISAIECLENEGHEVDEALMNGLRYIKDRKALIEAMVRRHETKTEAKKNDDSVHGTTNWVEQQDEDPSIQRLLTGVDRAVKSVVIMRDELMNSGT